MDVYRNALVVSTPSEILLIFVVALMPLVAIMQPLLTNNNSDMSTIVAPRGSETDKPKPMGSRPTRTIVYKPLNLLKPIDANEQGVASTHIVGVYKGKPVFFNVTIHVSPGNGLIVFRGVKLDKLAKLSMETAIYLAAMITGIPPWTRNYTVIIKPIDRVKATYISGASASAPVFFAAIKALGYDVNLSGKVFTGMISLDGLVGAVGGLKEKAEGVTKKGFGTLYYGEGSQYKLVKERLEIVIGPYVNLTTYKVFKPVYNVTGVPLVSVLQLLGVNTTNVTYERLLKVLEAMRDIASRCTEVKRVIELLVRRIDELLYELNSLDNREKYSEAIKAIETYKGLGDTLLDRGYCYAALEAYIIALQQSLLTYLKAIDSKEGLKRAIEELRFFRTMYLDLLSIANTTSSGYRNLTLRKLLILASAEKYASSAKRYEDIASKLFTLLTLVGLNGEVVSSIIDYAVRAIHDYVYALAYMQQFLLDDSDTMLDWNKTVRIIGFIAKLADVVAEYAYLVYLQSGVKSPLVSYANYYAYEALKALKRGDYIRALYLSIDSLQNSLLYFALHPGASQVWDERLYWIIYMLIGLSEHCKGIPPHHLDKLLYALTSVKRADTIIMEAERAYAWILACRLLSYGVGGGVGA